jgi:sulfoxide reductase heme-binding subunit YedZ
MTSEKTANPLRTAVNILSPIPLVVLVGAYFTGNLTVNPIQAATQRAGDIAIIFLLLCLACSPVNTLFDVPKVLKLRRPLGLWAFYYASLHMLSYVGLDYGFNFAFFNQDNANKLYVYVGFITLTLLSVLAFTSRRWWKVKLGKNWKKLHKLVYLAGAVAVVHLALVIKGNLLDLMGDLWKPIAAGSVLTVALILRIPAVKAWVVSQRQKIRAARAPKQPFAAQPPDNLPGSATLDNSAAAGEVHGVEKALKSE